MQCLGGCVVGVQVEDEIFLYYNNSITCCQQRKKKQAFRKPELRLGCIARGPNMQG